MHPAREELGLRWLHQVDPDHRDWGRVFAATPPDDTWLALGMDCLADATPAHRAWAKVWLGLFEHEPTDALFEHGLQW